MMTEEQDVEIRVLESSNSNSKSSSGTTTGTADPGCCGVAAARGNNGDSEPLPNKAWELDTAEMALELLEECPPTMTPDEYVNQIKAEIIQQARDKAASSRTAAKGSATLPLSGSSNQTGYLNASPSSSKDSLKMSNGNGTTLHFDPDQPSLYNKLRTTVTSMIISKNRVGVTSESTHFLRVLTTGTVELLEFTLGTPEDRRNAEPGKIFKGVPEDYRKLILEACSCITILTQACCRQDPKKFDPVVVGVHYLVDFLMDYLVINRVDCASGRYVFEFMGQIMGKLQPSPFQKRFLEKLIPLIKSTLTRLCVAQRPPKQKSTLTVALIDTLFVYLNLLECLAYSLREIDEATMLNLRSFERVVFQFLPSYPVISVITSRIGVQAQMVYNRMERRMNDLPSAPPSPVLTKRKTRE